MLFADLSAETCSDSIEALFPRWSDVDEQCVLLSPHDDDALLGAGYLIQAVRRAGGHVTLLILCDGSAGYSALNAKADIVAIRRQETTDAYRALGFRDEDIHRFDIPDFSLAAYIGWRLPDGSEGLFPKMLRLLRQARCTRLVAPNGYREHWDHRAGHLLGMFDGVQAGDPVLADAGKPTDLRSMLEYSVWGDFAPEDALVAGRNPRIRANRAILAPETCERAVAGALQAFASQARIIDRLLRSRAERRVGDYYAELYRTFDPRPKLDYAPYRDTLARLASDL